MMAMISGASSTSTPVKKVVPELPPDEGITIITILFNFYFIWY